MGGNITIKGGSSDVLELNKLVWPIFFILYVVVTNFFDFVSNVGLKQEQCHLFLRPCHVAN
jgi:hypothetical protein